MSAASTPGPAETSLRRVFAQFIACGYAIFLALSIPGALGYAPRFAEWWTPMALAVVFLPGLWLGVEGIRGSLRQIRLCANIAATGYLIAIATGFVAWLGPQSNSPPKIWLVYFPALCTMAAVAGAGYKIGIIYLLVAVLGVQAISYRVSSNNNGLFWTDIAFTASLCSIFVAATVMAIRTGRLLDETRTTSEATAAAAAAAGARAAERQRLDALVHDQVMATLLAVDRQGSTPTVRRSADQALRHLSGLLAAADTDSTVDALHLAASIRSAVGELDTEATIHFDLSPNAVRLPGEAARALVDATAEAVRNSVRHAGRSAQRSVSVVVDTEQVGIRVTDNGCGFDPRSVPSHRLGIRVSIHNRTQTIPGATAAIDSTLGRGTTVTLGWEPTA